MTIENLRAQFDQYAISGYIITSSDEFQSEYPSESFKRLEFMSGFPCSNGIMIVLKNDLLFFTDGRYKLVAKEALKEAKIYDIKDLPTFSWQELLNAREYLGYDPAIMTSQISKLLPEGSLKEIKANLVDVIWHQKPQFAQEKPYKYIDKYSGEDDASKISRLRSIMQKSGLECLFISSPESVCWLLNIRGSDSKFSPIFLSFCYIDESSIILFAHSKPNIDFSENVSFDNIESVSDFLQKINTRIGIDKKAPLLIKNSVKTQYLKEIDDPILSMRAVKNVTEIECAKNVHIHDASALIEFLAWLKNERSNSDLTEFSIGKKLTYFRSLLPGYISDSFPPICGFGPNSAKIHYKAEQKTSSRIHGDNLLLIDSGGHYLGGTTDVTRTIVLGKASAQHINYYTRVLKGHLELSKIKFPPHITGSNLDILARKFLWNISEDYSHGTGHGVGNALSVHEGPASISIHDRMNLLKAGMILSNEPGYYKDGEFGIRIENLQFIKNVSAHSNFLEFEQLTLVPYCSELISVPDLEKEQLQHLQEYYKKIENLVLPRLSELAKKYCEIELVRFL